ncbi:hypothetical protein NEMBOFW57_009914 [Staphylotrichum longicolle]|uniref:Carboxylic ester hydrolase n=1 Tax=Staphylotrichum longicolle TaxID=669026 RepID=A0AAD4ETM1_9PEZI|nr:hypothetical protein NEMBOFW57_009914 [Staphylotrichum longicolle]
MCLPQLKLRGRRRTALGPWLSAAAVLLLLWLYLSGSGPRPEPRVQTGWVVNVDKHGGSAQGAQNDKAKQATTTTTTTEIAMAATQKPAAAVPTDPAVVLRQGTYKGTTLLASPRFPKAIEAFRGVPYAQDTGGENRFRPPQPLPESTGTFDAIEWGKICPAEGVVRRNMSENCLNANIYRPAGLVDRDGYQKTEGSKKKKRPRLPVVVYVHGGGFNTGHGTERNMATFVAWADAPMVAVNFNYRVGALGFLPSDVTAREGLLNLGLRDQQMLLEWVQANIEAFGGDPKKVTIMGLSAGAHSIGHHIMYYSKNPAKAPFSKAILESGATTARAVFYPTHPRHLVQFREFLIAAGAAGVRNPTSSPTCAPSRSRRSSAPPKPSGTTRTPPHPLIPDLPINSWLAGAHLRIPLITGYNTNEGTSFIPAKANKASEFRAFFQALIPSLTQADLDKLEALYPDPVTTPSSPYKRVPKGMGKQWARLDAAYSHYAYICPVLQTAHYMSEAADSKSGGVYVYRYAATAAHGTANHADETPVVAHDLEELQGMKGIEEVADAMHGRWARFVASVAASPDLEDGEGDGAAAAWPRFVSPLGGKAENKKKRDGTGRIMVFGEGNDERGGGKQKGVPARVVEMTELEREACRFWWERVGLSQGVGKREEVVGARL